MTRMWTIYLTQWLELSQERVLTSLRSTDARLVRQRPAPTAPSIGFHAWHLARWADRHQVALGRWLDDKEPQSEIWIAGDLPAAWGFGSLSLGDLGIGAGLDDDASAMLPLPNADLLTEYVRATFRALVGVIGRIEDDDRLDLRVLDLSGDDNPISEVLFGLLSHTNRHLGMMEALRGVLGEHGSATV